MNENEKSAREKWGRKQLLWKLGVGKKTAFLARILTSASQTNSNFWEIISLSPITIGLNFEKLIKKINNIRIRPIRIIFNIFDQLFSHAYNLYFNIQDLTSSLYHVLQINYYHALKFNFRHPCCHSNGYSRLLIG